MEKSMCNLNAVFVVNLPRGLILEFITASLAIKLESTCQSYQPMVWLSAQDQINAQLEETMVEMVTKNLLAVQFAKKVVGKIVEDTTRMDELLIYEAFIINWQTILKYPKTQSSMSPLFWTKELKFLS